MRLEAIIHPDFVKDYLLDDEREDRPGASITVVPGEFVYIAIQQVFNGSLEDVAYLLFDFETYQKEGKVGYATADLSFNKKRRTKEMVLDQSIRKGETQYYVPKTNKLRLPPVILKLVDSPQA